MEFEESYFRLEKILEKMNSGKVSLDELLVLYEQAHQLIIACQKKLNEAEKKVEILIKERDGELAVDEEGNPLIESFIPKN